MRKDHGIAAAGVIGSGTMGAGIAMAIANAGIPVTILDANAEALERGMDRIRDTYQRSVDKGRMTAEDAAVHLGNIRSTSDLADLSGLDLVTEAIFEDMDAKLNLVRKLDAILAPDAIIASNTSTLDIDEIAAASSHPERVLGMHYFSPAHVMKLLEIVEGAKTSPELVERAVAFGHALGKIPVVVGVCFGFVGNRMLFARAAQSERTLLEGATPSQNDSALTDFGFPMGQHEMMDLSGLDVEWRIRQPRGEVRPVSDRLYEMNRWGQKTGAGFYKYEKGKRGATPDPEVEALCRDIGRELGYAQRAFSEQELLERQLYPLVNEGVKILEEGVARSVEDIDTIWRSGYGWPADKIGPMAWAETIGAKRLCERLDFFAQETGDDAFRPAASLRRAAASGTSIAHETRKDMA